MYTACIHCASRLGANEVIEHFPVGAKLAFDAAKGRLWVVCAKCGRWNLTPLEERWEAIEEAERVYRGARHRYGTENIGLARHASGLELIRIGAPLLPEFAGWRYGRNVVARRKREARIGMAVAGGAAIAALGLVATGAIFTLPFTAYQLGAIGWGRWRQLKLARGLRLGNRRVTLDVIRYSRIISSTDRADWRLRLGGELNGRELAAESAAPLLAAALPVLNVSIGSEKSVAAAVNLVDTRSQHGLITSLGGAGEEGDPLGTMRAERRLALEIAANEDFEREALAADLVLLEARWREAEEVAAIADDLLLPESVRGFLDRARKR